MEYATDTLLYFPSSNQDDSDPSEHFILDVEVSGGVLSPVSHDGSNYPSNMHGCRVVF